MNCIQLFGITFLVTCVVILVYPFIREIFHKGGDFTMKNQPKPPIKEYQKSWYDLEFERNKKEIERLKEVANDFKEERNAYRKANKNLEAKIERLKYNQFESNLEIDRLKKELEGVI